ncbi:MAG: hypothetical protein R3Y09_07170 [Clostridia bacterium]
MVQLQTYLKRLKNPTVVLSIVSEIILVLTMLNINVDEQAVNVVVTGILTILVTLGIMSNPDTVNHTYSDDISYCESCEKDTVHAKIANEMICTNCQTPEE